MTGQSVKFPVRYLAQVNLAAALTERDYVIRSAADAGVQHDEIGRHLGLTARRIRQIAGPAR